MNFRLLAFLLALSVSAWAQTAAQNAPGQSAHQAPKVQCACCEKAAAETASACRHHAKGKDDKDAAGCCGGKEGSSCCGKAMQCGKSEAAKTGSCCADKACCGEGKSCCGKSTEGEKTSMKCCQDKQCERHHATEHPSSGN